MSSCHTINEPQHGAGNTVAALTKKHALGSNAMADIQPTLAQAAPQQTKTCKDCGQAKPLALFTADKRKPDGRTSRCRECRNAYLRTWSAKPEQVAKRLAHQRANPELMAAYNRKYRKSHPEKEEARTANWRKANPEKARAHWAVANAIRSGTIVRPALCGCCGRDCKPEAHHADYSKPLDVVWMCHACHIRQEHSSVVNGAEQKATKPKRTKKAK